MDTQNSSIFNTSVVSAMTNDTDTHKDNIDEKTSKGYNIEPALPFLIIGCLGVLLNGFTIIVLGSSNELRRKILNTLIIHQSIIDFLSSAYLIGTAHLSMGDLHGLKGTIADIYCIFLPGKMLFWTPVLVSTLHLIWINVERYISIIYPMFHHLHITRKTVIKMMVVIWAFGIFTNFLLETTYRSVDGMCNIGPGDALYYRWYVIIIIHVTLEFFLPLIIFVGLNTHIYFKLKTQVFKMSEIEQSKNKRDLSERDRNLEKATRNIFKLMVLMTFCYCVCYGFNMTYVSLWIAGVVKDITGKASAIMIRGLNCLIIYGGMKGHLSYINSNN